MYTTEYWKNFYSSHKKLQESSFSRFCLNYTKAGETMLDVCCGDGRDSTFFQKNEIKTYSFDIHDTNKDLKNYYKFDLNSKLPRFKSKVSVDNVYCRFTLHAVPEDLEDYILVNSNTVLNPNGLLLIEARSNKGTILDSINDHYRRLIDIDIIKNKLLNLNFDIIHQEERSDLSINDNENPVLIRIIARKRGPVMINNAKSFDDIHSDIVSLGYLQKTEAKYVLETTKKIFDFNNINFLLVFGTLLGAYRDKDFITHDEDVDIAILEKERLKIEKLINQGYFKMYGLSVSRNNKFLISMDNGKVYIDFYFFAKNYIEYRCSSYKLSIAEATQENPNKIEFLGQEYSTVPNIENYLRIRYGKDWKTPIKNNHAKN